MFPTEPFSLCLPPLRHVLEKLGSEICAWGMCACVLSNHLITVYGIQLVLPSSAVLLIPHLSRMPFSVVIDLWSSTGGHRPAVIDHPRGVAHITFTPHALSRGHRPVVIDLW